ncbi:MBL fold metallo-hydrolase [Rhodohalobacter sp. SW132]|uniref:MBL fold metallo-hydrolase n=1 Tax=Rhodohalobacter sp. SW132 TaxID=2293433 RepID=UPI000E221639|nr:MBL fold metallo-hydrolase [Rhodohalobacter sp. SW132]REL39306.1 MBL fold metallo-hydrolase [Rhodohalobacter sp. SW132]
MNRSSFLKHLALLSAGTALLPRLKVFQNSPFTEIRNGIGTFSMRGGTIGWMARPGFTVVVDSQYSDTASDFLEGISRFDSGPETVLINSHHHGDHTSGNGTFREAGYRIFAHEQVPVLQRRGADNPDEVVAADETYSENLELDAGNETVLLKYYGNAHTGGDSVTWFENSNIAHMGDLVFNRLYPFIDRDGGASIEGWINLLERVSDEADSDTIFIFGHGNPEFGITGSSADLLHMRDFLSKVLEHTQQGISAGRSREEITQIESFDEFPDYISPSDFLSLPRNLNVAYRELTE